MNKLVKAAIATSVGAALLMGGAGTFAFWNDQVGVSGANITAGTLTVTDPAPTNGVWQVQKDGTGTLTTVSIATFLASPGDKLTYTKTVKVTATGDNLVATLSLGAGSIAAATPVTSAGTDLAAALTKSASIAATGTGITAGGVAGTYTFTPGSTGITNQDVTVTVVITFPKGTAGQYNTTKTGAVTLSGLTVNIDQV
jgi:alternate signal-mediated exported protein